MGDDLWTLLCQQDGEEQDDELVEEVQSSDHMTDLLVRTLRALQDPIFSGIASQGSKQGQRQSVEVNVNNLPPEVQRRFGKADAKEWKAILESGAVRILSVKEASLVRRRYADRIISSRMMRRLKPQEGLGAEPLPKSSWCVRGHQDPDSEDLHVYAPTPQSESIMAVLQMIASLKLYLEIADAKNAFCQSDRLVRPKGSIFAEPCEGLGLESGSLIELVAPVYGLNDAPILWHRTLTEWLVSQGYRKSLVESCLYVKHESGSLVGLALVEVDFPPVGKGSVRQRSAREVQVRKVEDP